MKKGKGKKDKKVEKSKTKSVSPRKEEKLWRYLPVVLLFLLTILLFSGFVFSDQMLFGTDTIEAGVMFRSFYASFVDQYHAIPQWNPYLFGGMPFVDAMHGDTFYPLALLQFILPISRALGWKLVLTVFLAGAFMYLCMRAFRFSRMVSLFSAVAYMFSANLVTWVYGGQDGRMYVTSLLPLLFFFLEKALNSRKWIYYIGLGFAIGLLILANHPQLAYYALWAVGLYFLFRLVMDFTSRKEESTSQKIKPLIKPVVLFVVATVIGLALSLVQILPPYVYVNKYSPRAEGGRGYDYAVSWSAHPEELVSQVVPEFCGYSFQEENTYWGRNYFKQNADYGGVIPLLFAFLGLLFVKDRKRWFFLGLSGLAIIYSLGGHTPIYRLFYHLVPQVKNFRAPGLILFLLIFSVVFLSALFLQRLLNRGIKDSSEQKRLFKTLLIVVAAFFGLSFLFTIAGSALLSIWTGIIYPGIDASKGRVLSQNLSNVVGGFWIATLLIGLATGAVYLLVKERIAPTFFIIGVGILLIFDLWRIDAKFIRNFDYNGYFRKDGAIEFLQRDTDKFRVISLPGTYQGQNILAYHNVGQVLGYHGNQLKAYDDFTERKYLESARTQEEYGRRYADFLFGPKPDMLNVKYFLSRQPFEHAKFEQAFHQGGIYVFQNRNYLPRARIVFDYEVIRDREDIMERITDPTFDYRSSVILEEEPEISSAPEDTSTPLGVASIDKDEINSMTVKAVLSQPGFLILSENHYPSWKVYVDEKPDKIYRANYLFRAVYLDEGEHQVRFVFDSATYRLGKTSTLLTSVLLLAIFGFYGIRRVVSKSKKQQ
jgi:hypothetical protein